MKKRIEWVDMVKCICILFVVLSHLESSHIATRLRSFYDPFFLSGFLFASGYTYTNNRTFKNHIISKIKGLLIPWFTFSMLNIMISSIFTFNPEMHSSVINDFLVNTLQVYGYCLYMWFVAALFIAYIPFYFFVRSYENDKSRNRRAYIKYSLISIILFFANRFYFRLMPEYIFPWGSNRLPWHIDYIPYAICFMYFGYLFKDKLENICEHNKKINGMIVSFVYLLLVIMSLLISNDYNILVLSLMELIKSIFGILFIVFISKSIGTNKYLLFFGQNTLIYFGIHGKPLSLWEKVLELFASSFKQSLYTNELLATIYSLIIGTVFMFILIIPAKFINKYMPFMMGKWYKKPQEKNA